MLLDFRYMLHLEKILNNKSEGKPRFNFDNKKLPEPSKIRTLILDLHDAIRTTPSSYFKSLQTLEDILKMYNS